MKILVKENLSSACFIHTFDYFSIYFKVTSLIEWD